jgi:hypothetical protein
MENHNCEKLWVDQLCIDQGTTGERNHQVQMMAEIYRQASYVYVWLGGADENVRTIRAGRLRLRYLERSLGHCLWSNACMNTTHKVTMSLHAIMDHPYWLRTWIAQEFLSARRIRILCGECIVSFDELQEWLTLRDIYRDYVSPVIWLIKHAFTNPTLSYTQLISTFSQTRSTFPRDKIYGLLGFVHPSKRIQVDYATPIQLIFLDVGSV